MSDRPPAWIDPLPDPETSDGDGGADIESGDDSGAAAPEDLQPGRPPSP